MDNQKQYSLLMEAFNAVYDNISESHFKVGDEVVCKKSGMEGEVVKLDKPDGKEDEKYYTVKREDGKKVKYSPNELKLAEEAKNGGVPKKKEEKFHTKLDKLVHSTFGSSPEEKKMKEEVEIDEDAGIVSGLVGLALGAKGAYNAAKKSKRMRDYPKNFVKGIADPRTYVPQKKKEQKEEFDIFDVILEHLVAEGYADTNQAALAIMANMSEEWKQSIVEAPGEWFGGLRDKARASRAAQMQSSKPTPKQGPTVSSPFAKPASTNDSGRLTTYGAGGGAAAERGGKTRAQVMQQGAKNLENKNRNPGPNFGR